MTDIVAVLDQILKLNINKCAYTTYDVNIIECARREIIKGLAESYNIDYEIKTKPTQTFPVPKKSRLS